jgi:hypothetical protein
MIGVEVPDYSWVVAFMSGVVAVATVGALRVWWRRSAKSFLDKTEAFERAKEFAKHTTRIFQEPTMWSLRPHLKEYDHLCGFTKPEEWQCCCGKIKCEAFGELCKGVGGTGGVVPAHPKPDRRAAVAHTKAKS